MVLTCAAPGVCAKIIRSLTRQECTGPRHFSGAGQTNSPGPDSQAFRMEPPTLVPRSYAVRYEPASDAPLGDDVLACVHFAAGAGAGDGDPRRIRVQLEQFGADPQMEVWRSTRPVEHGWSDGFGYAHNGDVLFGH